MIENPLNVNIFRLETSAIGDPAAGADFIWNPPSQTRCLILGLAFHIVTDATPVGRIPLIFGHDGTNRFQSFISTTGPGPTAALDLMFAPGIEPIDRITTYNQVASPLPYPFFIQPGDTLQSEILLLAAADQISDIIVRFQAWQDT